MSNHIKIPRLSDTVLVNFSRESPTSDPILLAEKERINLLILLMPFKAMKQLNYIID